MPGQWPLTGRAEELGLIGGLIRRRHGPVGVVVAGAVGVGKTRLAQEALAAAEHRGALIRWVVATAAVRVLPLGAFAAALRGIGPDRGQLMHQASEALLAGAGQAGVVIGVDDAHLLDELSAALVHQLVQRRVARVVLTLRTGETTPDAVTALWKDGHLLRMELPPLSQTETARLVEARLGGPVDSATTRRLWALTRGNALYLQQLVDGELESGRLHQVAGLWQGSENLALSPGLVELVSARISQLSEAEQDVVDVLALGEPLGVSLLEKLTDALAVEQVEARGLVKVYLDGQRLQARLAHPLYGELRRTQMGWLHARRLRGRIASALAAIAGRRTGDTLRRAELMLDSDLSPDPMLFTEAAHRATELGDLAVAERLARAAVVAGGGFESRLLLGNALSWLGRGAEADTELATLSALARTSTEKVKAAIPRAATLAWGLGRPIQAQAVLDAATNAVCEDAALELAGMRSVVDAFCGRTVPGAAAAAAVLAHPQCSPGAAELATWGLAAAGGGLGRLDGLGEKVQLINARTESFQIGLHQAAVVGSSWVRGLLLAGLLDQAERAAARYHQQCQDTPGPGYAVTSVMCGQVAKSRGLVKTAARWFRQSLAAQGGADTGGWSFFTLLVDLPGVLGMAGDVISARQAFAEMTVARSSAFAFLDPEVLLAHAWVFAAAGSVSEAVALARQAAQLAASQDQHAVEVVALHTAVCFGDRTVADRLTQLVTRVEGPLAPAAAAHAVAWAAEDGAALLAASIQLEQIGTLLLAADAAAQAAAAHTRHDQHGSASAATTRAHRLAQACQGARTPALAALVTPLLTPREREILILAAEGLSNRQIAQRLVLSVRTVENHLYRACTKLHVSNRTELTTLLHNDEHQLSTYPAQSE